MQRELQCCPGSQALEKGLEYHFEIPDLEFFFMRSGLEKVWNLHKKVGKRS